MTTNATFLASLDNDTLSKIINSIASNYGIDFDAAIDEVIADDAEHLLDYLTGEIRVATSLLMKRKGF